MHIFLMGTNCAESIIAHELNMEHLLTNSLPPGVTSIILTAYCLS